MLKSCAFDALGSWVKRNDNVYVSLRTMTYLLEDMGYIVYPCRVLKGSIIPEVDIGFKNEHYYNMSEGFGEYPEIVFLNENEISLYQDDIRVITEEECQRLKGGKGETSITYPSTPAQPTTGQSMADWVANAPAVFAEQTRQAPLEAQQQLQLLQQYGTPMAQAYKTAQEALYPTTTALQEKMAGMASSGMDQGLTNEERQQYTSDINANLGSNVGSGIGADYMSRNMLMANQQRKDYNTNLGLSLAGRSPLAQPQLPQTNNYASTFTPATVMGFNSQNYATNAQASRPMLTGGHGWMTNALGLY